MSSANNLTPKEQNFVGGKTAPTKHVVATNKSTKDGKFTAAGGVGVGSNDRNAKSGGIIGNNNNTVANPSGIIKATTSKPVVGPPKNKAKVVESIQTQK
jgi:hypothetical protein